MPTTAKKATTKATKATKDNKPVVKKAAKEPKEKKAAKAVKKPTKAALLSKAAKIAKSKGFTRKNLTSLNAAALQRYLNARNNRRVNYVRYPRTFEVSKNRVVASAHPGCPAGFRAREKNDFLLCKPRLASFVKAASIAHRLVSYRDTTAVVRTLPSAEIDRLESHDQKIQDRLQKAMVKDSSNTAAGAGSLTMSLYESMVATFKEQLTAEKLLSNAYNAMWTLATLVGKVLGYAWTQSYALARTMWERRGDIRNFLGFLYNHPKILEHLYRLARCLTQLICGQLGYLNNKTANAKGRWGYLYTVYQTVSTHKYAVRDYAWSTFTRYFPLQEMCSTFALVGDAACGFVQQSVMSGVLYKLKRDGVENFINLITKTCGANNIATRNDGGAVTCAFHEGHSIFRLLMTVDQKK